MKEELEQIGRELREFCKKYNKEHVDIFVLNNSVHGVIFKGNGNGEAELSVWIESEDKNEDR